jgi:hypothetical protein
LSLANLLEHGDASLWYGGANQSFDEPLRYKWNDEKPTQHYNLENGRLQKELARGMRRRASLAVTIGFVEWTWLRLRRQTNDGRLPELIEASWASLVDWRYFNASSQSEQDLSKRGKGPILGPISIAHRHLFNSVVDASNETGFFAVSVYLSNLAEHVLSDRADLFKRWRRTIIERLKRIYPDDPNERLGPPVPREAIIESEFNVADTPKLLDAFLCDLKPDDNPYLAKPRDVKAAGINGTPYRFTAKHGAR